MDRLAEATKYARNAFKGELAKYFVFGRIGSQSETELLETAACLLITGQPLPSHLRLIAGIRLKTRKPGGQAGKNAWRDWFIAMAAFDIEKQYGLSQAQCHKIIADVLKVPLNVSPDAIRKICERVNFLNHRQFTGK